MPAKKKKFRLTKELSPKALDLGISHSNRSDFIQNLKGNYYNVEKSYKHAREKILHEDELVHQRLTWLITLNGLVFSALGFTLIAQGGALRPAVDDVDTAEFMLILNTIRFAMLIAGLGSSCAAFIGIVAAYRRISQERKIFYVYLSYIRGVIGDDLSKREAVGWMPRLTGHTVTNISGMVCGLLVPMIIGSAWSLIGWTMLTKLEVSYISWFVLGFQVFVLGAIGLAIFYSVTAMTTHIQADKGINELHDLYDDRIKWIYRESNVDTTSAGSDDGKRIE